MLAYAKINRLANLIVESRQSGRTQQPLPPEALLPADAAEADAVQVATAMQIGPIGGYKVWVPAGKNDGLWGAIFTPGIYAAPAKVPAPELLIELEVAFRFARALPGREDGKDYTREEVEAAVEGALPVYELLAQRWETTPPALFPNGLLNRADTSGNWGLVSGTLVRDWKALVREDLKVELTIGGRQAVSVVGGHVSGNPAYPLTWLANALARHGHGLQAGQIVTTGAFGGAHPARAGEAVLGRIEGFSPIEMSLA